MSRNVEEINTLMVRVFEFILLSITFDVRNRPKHLINNNCIQQYFYEVLKKYFYDDFLAIDLLLIVLSQIETSTTPKSNDL